MPPFSNRAFNAWSFVFEGFGALPCYSFSSFLFKVRIESACLTETSAGIFTNPNIWILYYLKMSVPRVIKLFYEQDITIDLVDAQ